MKEFLAMGGYAAYVWTSYGVTALVVALNVWLAQRRYRRALGALRRADTQTEPVRQPTVKRRT